MEDPYHNGLDVINLASTHQRSRRSVWDGLKFKLEAPSVDWRKHIGSSALGASFGVIMLNLLDLAIGNLYELFCAAVEWTFCILL